MKALRINADYEAELFLGKKLPKVNASLEFIAFFVEQGPFRIDGNYTHEFVNYVEEKRGGPLLLVRDGAFENWWGSLTDLKLEKWSNSKITSAELLQKMDESRNCYILQSEKDLADVSWTRPYLLKDPFGMSGKGLLKISSRSELTEIKGFPKILEPLLDRRHDFSHYVSDDFTIAYENIVDQKFQYKGTVFRNWKMPSLSQLSFYDEVDSSEWINFEKALARIKAHYPISGFSIDSFVYAEESALRIHPLSEVNHRKTMGLLTYLLAQKFANGNWCAFLIGKFTSAKKFNDVRADLKSLEQNVLMLSPVEANFQYFFIWGRDKLEGLSVIEGLKSSLPYCQFPIDV